ncbi:DUF6268 family outer membrane beta-barrel protein [Anatilimnocola floriformis]|uniref:DUF6268 family outer membrane beta-barrel protein n=1 Tax=Anatilimnocola floriformis TaxID=2948575 RepID=UPI0020C23D52|nr:DUF6268 family outer membrane beta-barrel protein [Anatilimnocola floriformis]
MRYLRILSFAGIAAAIVWANFWISELHAQQEIVRRPPPGLAGVQLGTEARKFQQSSQLQPYAVPGEIQLATQMEQPELLPPPDGVVMPGQPFLYDALNQPAEVIGPGQEFNSDGTVKLSPYKKGFFQKLCLSADWLGGGSDPKDLGITEIESSLTVALPAPIREWPLFIMPGYNLYLMQDPGGLRDMPSQLHTVYLDFTWAPQFFDRHRLLLTVAPSLYTDFQVSTSDAFRLTGKALYVWDAQPDRLQFVAGVLYLNRDNIRLLPAGGAIWKPTPDYNFELIFPKPKLGMRVNVDNGYEDWLYIAGEFGGNTWAIERDSGADDKVTWSDWRLLGGYERRLDGGAGYRLEAGYVFNRKVEYASAVGDYNPRPTFIVRGGISF